MISSSSTGTAAVLDQKWCGIAPRGYAPLPRYFSLRFSVRRRKNKLVVRPKDPDKARLRAKAQQLRETGMSYPAIARTLGISVGTVWNYAHRGD